MKLKQLSFCVLTFALMSSSAFAQLPSLTYVETNRSVSFQRSTAQGVGFTATAGTPSTITSDGLGQFQETIAGADYFFSDSFQGINPGLDPIASQSTNIDFNSISGTGFFDGRSFFDNGASQLVVDQGESALNVVFDLSGPTEFTFGGSTTGSSLIVLLEGENNAFIDFDNVIAGGGSGIGPLAFSEAGILDAGRYELIVARASDLFIGIAQVGFPDSSDSFDFNLTLQVVPEPSSLSLGLFVAIAGLTKRRRQWSVA